MITKFSFKRVLAGLSVTSYQVSPFKFLFWIKNYGENTFRKTPNEIEGRSRKIFLNDPRKRKNRGYQWWGQMGWKSGGSNGWSTWSAKLLRKRRRRRINKWKNPFRLTVKLSIFFPRTNRFVLNFYIQL